MRRRVVLTYLSLLLGCAEVGQLTSTVCEEPCYTGPALTNNRGSCRPGVPRCAEGEVVACEGQVLPGIELCNGLDDDCDGVVDEYVTDPGIQGSCNNDVEPPFFTGTEAQCQWGQLVCRAGALECYGFIGPSIEICDGVDNDCDGLIDEDQAAVGVCYSGDPNDLSHPNVACRAGVIRCAAGAVTCQGEIRPTREVCDRVDNDCDGAVDNVGTATTAQPVDLVLMLDVSGSMSDKLARVRTALMSLLQIYSSDFYRYAIVYVPGMVDGAAEVILPLTSAQDVISMLASLSIGGGGVEPSYDAAVQCVDGTFQLDWRAGAVRAIAFFGDEDAQSVLGYSEHDATLELLRVGAVFYAFITPEHVGDYLEITQSTGGAIFNLVSSAIQLQLHLTSTLQNGCTF